MLASHNNTPLEIQKSSACNDDTSSTPNAFISETIDPELDCPGFSTVKSPNMVKKRASKYECPSALVHHENQRTFR